jgi:hypothetical protein
MQLRNARLCLDCEEVHESQQCPICASESFVFLTRWVPAPERRQKPRTGPPPSPDETVDTYREILNPRPNSAGWRFVKGGAMGLALFGVASLMFRNRDERRPESKDAPLSGSRRRDSDSQDEA